MNIKNCYPDIQFDDEYFSRHYIGGLPCQMKLGTWLRELNSDPNVEINRFIADGIAYGFPIVDDTNIPSYFTDNYKSATQGDAKVFFDKLFCEELKESKYVLTSKVPHCVHAIGAVEKGPKEFRPITDCRRPLGISINNFMQSTYQYFNV